MPLHIETSDTAVPSPVVGSGRPRAQSRAAAVGRELLATIRTALVVFGPVAPRTLVTNGPHSVRIAAERGATTRSTFVVRNRQSATVVVSPALGILHGPQGVRWAPDHSIRVAQRLLAPGAITEVEFELLIGQDVPDGRYAGIFAWPGLIGATPLVVEVREGSEP